MQCDFDSTYLMVIARAMIESEPLIFEMRVYIHIAQKTQRQKFLVIIVNAYPSTKKIFHSTLFR